MNILAYLRTKVSGPAATGWFIAIYIALGIVWELFALTVWGSAATISYVIINWSTTFPVVALGLGVLMGHFFWQLNWNRPGPVVQLSQAFVKDPHYAQGWHDNIATAAMTRGLHPEAANEVATQFMGLAFGVKTKRPE